MEVLPRDRDRSESEPLDRVGRVGFALIALPLASVAVLTLGVVLWRRWWVDAPYHAAWLSSLASDPTNPTDPYSESPTESPFVSPT